MTYTPTSSCFGTGGAVSATVDNTDTNFGASPFAATGRSETSTQLCLTDQLNVLNVGTSVPNNAQTT